MDDICWACKVGYEHHINRILSEFSVRKVERRNFRFCGKQVTQDKEFNIAITCTDAIEAISPVKFNNKDRKLTDEATEA